MAAARIDIEIKKTLESIKENVNYKLLHLPNYIIHEDHKRIIIINNDKKQSRMLESYEPKITYKLDLFNGIHKYKKFFKDKLIVISAGIHYLIITNPYHVIDCDIDFSDAIDLEYLEYSYHEVIRSNDAYKTILWPPNLKYLILHNYPYPLYNLPNGLQYLRLPRTISGSLDNLPASLIGLDFDSTPHGYKYDVGLNYLPHGLRYLGLLGAVNCELDNLPLTLEVLHIGAHEYTQSLNYLPDNIRYLTVDTSSVPITKLPNALKELTIHYDYVRFRNTYDILEDMNFPEGFEKLIIIDDLMQTNSNVRREIQDLITEKNTSINGHQIVIEYH
jgi:hypothetical protein